MIAFSLLDFYIYIKRNESKIQYYTSVYSESNAKNQLVLTLCFFTPVYNFSTSWHARIITYVAILR